MFQYSFILKMQNYIEGVLLHRNVNSESIILICGHYKTGMCLACPKECWNTVAGFVLNSKVEGGCESKLLVLELVAQMGLLEVVDTTQ